MADWKRECVTTRDVPTFAARSFADAIAADLKSSPDVRVGVAGGSVLEILRRARALIPLAQWQRVKLIWVDERCVPVGSDESNRGSAYRKGALELSAAPMLELPLFIDGETPETASMRVESAFATVFGGGLDVTLLGMGEDGHIASLFPGHFDVDPASFAVIERQSPKPPSARVSLTLRALRTAHTHILAAAGEAKREALKRVFDDDPTLPATHLRHVTIITDQRGIDAKN